MNPTVNYWGALLTGVVQPLRADKWPSRSGLTREDAIEDLREVLAIVRARCNNLARLSELLDEGDRLVMLADAFDHANA